MRLEIKFGLIGGVLFILWELAEYLLGFHDVKIKWLRLTGLLSIFIPFVILFFGILAKRKGNPGFYLTLREGVKTGLVISLIMALVSGAFFYVYSTAIHPEFMEIRTEWNRKSLYDKLMASEQAESSEQARRISVEQVAQPSPFQASNYYAMTRVSLGLTLSLFISLMMKSNPPPGYGEEEEEEDDDEEEIEDNVTE